MKKILWIIILLALCNTVVADKWWTGDAGNSNWFDPNNWTDGDSNAVPSNPESARVLVPYGTGTWPILNNGIADPNLCIVGGTWGHPGRLVVATGGTLNTNSDMWIAENDPCSAFDPCGIGMEALITGGSVNIGKHLTVGNVADGNFVQSGGNVYVYNDTFIGLNAPASGTLEITGGGFDTRSMFVHDGLVKIDGGNVDVLVDIQLATDPCREPNTVELQMKSGTLAIDSSLSVGHAVSAKFVQSGGDTDIWNYTYLGINAPAAGTLEITGGTFDTGAMSLYDGQVVIGGSAAVGVTHDILVASEPNRGPSVPEFQVNNGALTVGTDLTVGHATNGKFAQSAGDVDVTASTFLGRIAPAVGTLQITGGTFDTDAMWVHDGLVEINGGNLNVPGTLGLACDPCRAPDNVPEIQVKSGTLNTNPGDLDIGYAIDGKLAQSGGTVNADDTFLGLIAPASGTLKITGGKFNTGSTWVHAGLIEIDGGEMEITTGTLGLACDPCRGPDVPEIQVKSGKLNVPRYSSLSIGYGNNGKLAQSGGDVFVYDGLYLGSYAPACGTLQITGGSFDTGSTWVHYGLVEIDGGDMAVTGTFGLACDPARDPNNWSEVQMKSGTFSADYLNIGQANNGKFVQSGGTVTANSATTLAPYDSACGILEVTGGNFNVPTGGIWVRDGRIVIDGGIVTTASDIWLAKDASHEPNLAELQVKSGTLNINNNLGIREHDGEFVQSGGTVNIAGGVYLGQFGGYGIMEVTGGNCDISGGINLYDGRIIIDGNSAVVNVGYDIHVPEANDRDPNFVDELQIKNGTLTSGWNVSIGHVDDGQCIMSGGNLFVTNGVILGCHEDAVGQMEMSGGNLQANNIFLGGGWGDATQGFWDMTGGDITLYDDNHGLMVSNQGSSTPEPNGTESVFTMDGGTIDTPVLIVGRQGTGKFLMSGGTVDISDRMWIGEHFDPCDGLYTGHEGLVELYGGQINVAADVNCDPNVGTLDICGGALVLEGNRTGDVNDWITEGWLIACNGNADIIYDYNDTNPGKTTVIADCEGLPAGNLNNDCKVDFRDFAILADHWLEDAGLNCTSYPVGDIDEDCIVDIYDLVIIVDTWLDDTSIL